MLTAIEHPRIWRRMPDPDPIPVGVWPVRIVAKRPPSEGGVYRTKKNQPYSPVIGMPGSDEWAIDATHELRPLKRP